MDKFKLDVGNVQNDATNFSLQAASAFARVEGSVDEAMFQHSELQEKLAEAMMNVNNEILQEQITEDTTYIMILFVLFIALYIFIYIKV